MPLFLAALLMTAPVDAVQTEPTASAPAPAPAKVKKICRSDDPTSSRLTKKTCHTREEWAEIDSSNQQNVDRIQNDRRSTNQAN